MNEFATALLVSVAAVVIAVAFVVALITRPGRKIKKARDPQWVNGRTGQPVAETEGGKLFAMVGLKNTCPDCGGKGFFGGPEGGMSQNISCKNVECRAGFNLTPFGSGQGLCERISRSDIDRYPAESFGEGLTPGQRLDAKNAIKAKEAAADKDDGDGAALAAAGAAVATARMF